MTSSLPIPIRTLGRQLLPRTVRNLARSPVSAVCCLRAQAGYVLGRRESQRLRDDWTVRCHPVSSRGFELFARDPDSIRELDAFVAGCTPDMQFIDVLARLVCLPENDA